MPDTRTNHAETMSADEAADDGSEMAVSEREASPPLGQEEGGPAAGQMAALRDLIFGEQQRDLNGRLESLERLLDVTRDDILARLERDVSGLVERSSGQVEELTRDLTAQIEEQGQGQSAALSEVSRTLSAEIEGRDEAQGARLGAFQQEVIDRLEQLSGHFSEQLEATRAEFAAQLSALAETLDGRLTEMQQAVEARDELLRDEFLSVAESLEDRKASSSDLGQMLMDLGARLRLDSEAREQR